MTEPTPGPWTIEEDWGLPRTSYASPRYHIVGQSLDVGEKVVAFTITNRADAHLIAAAPAMREALRQNIEWFRQYADGHEAKGDIDKAKRNRDRQHFNEAALAQAGGGG